MQVTWFVIGLGLGAFVGYIVTKRAAEQKIEAAATGLLTRVGVDMNSPAGKVLSGFINEQVEGSTW